MDVQEFWEQTHEPHRTHTELMRKHMWSTGPGLITQNSDGYTVQVQPAIKYTVEAIDGSTQTLDMPVLQDIPILHLGGGGVVLTMPIAKDDEVMLAHCHRPIDSWWQSGGSQSPIDSRDHHITDAFAIPGLWSQGSRKLQNVSTSTIQLRTTGGSSTFDEKTGKTTFSPTAFLELTPGGQLNFKGTSWTTDVPTHAYKGHLIVTGEITLNGINLSTHKHNNVVSGGDLTGPPVSSLEMFQRWGIVSMPVVAVLLAIDLLLRLIG